MKYKEGEQYGNYNGNNAIWCNNFNRRHSSLQVYWSNKASQAGRVLGISTYYSVLFYGNYPK